MLNHNDDLITEFERKMAEYAGARYGVAIDSCSNALFLCLKYLQAEGLIRIPNQTYLSVPMQIIHAGCQVEFIEWKWTGCYQLYPYDIIDAAVSMHRGMYIEDTLFCISFQERKILNLGKGGMILTDDREAADYLHKLAFDGRTRYIGVNNDKIDMIGYHMNMTPETAAKGIMKLNYLPDDNPPGDWTPYRDLSKMEIFKCK